MNVRFFNPGKMYQNIKAEVNKEMQRVLESGDLILRDDVEKFEEKLAEVCNTKYAAGLNSCTDALYLSLWHYGVGAGDEVIVPSRTFVASVQVIVQRGATPVFYDVGEEDIERLFTEKTKAVIPVHIEGEFDRCFWDIFEICSRKNIPIIEDAAQAIGAINRGYKAGSAGDVGCFSFYPAKILGCFGDGGAITTNNEEVYKSIKALRNHDKEGGFKKWGVNSRLDNLQAAVLNVRIKYLQQALDRRAEIAGVYTNKLGGQPVGVPPHTGGRVWQDYIIRTTKRDELYEFLKENGVETMKNNYPFPVPKLPNAQKYEDETLRLPCNETLEDDEVQYVIKKIKAFFSR